ncbi:hypothetical protein CSC70_08505 [Pseudoxanthomonas kalamensis DSM 18571]|uniref:hypothetical protein n=1 Tax=Pseudoxanthomonas kalamensis TaxID=289483 RepID=UPI00139081FE|nr:hypothetical protein [Pseudoxanthomonas kalamensis]KAF1709735.1 hypothetical protein CSC70_08505 [Pseudoxanthomonas kalamensis DSM 18571]
MTKAADIIEALAGRQSPPLLERQTGLPHGWGLWLRAQPEKLGRIEHVQAQALAEELAGRAPPAPMRLRIMGRLRTLRSLFYQQWDPPPREERGLRWFAAIFSGLLHLAFAVLLIVLAWVHLPPPPPPQADSGSGSRVQVELVDRTDAADDGSQTAEPTTTQRSAAESPTAASHPAAAPQADDAEDRPQPAVSEQPLQVTEAERPTTDFVLTAPVRTEVPVPSMRTTEVQLREREVTVVETPQPLARQPLPTEVRAPDTQTALPALRQREVNEPLQDIRVPQTSAQPVDATAIRTTQPQLQVREVDEPLPQIRAPRTAASTVEAPQVRAPEMSMRQAEIPAPTVPSPAAAATPSTSTSSAAAATPSANSAAPGATITPRATDDWGAASAQPGNGSGLFNADGSVRLPDGAGQAAEPVRGAPGTQQHQAYQADRGSKWLQRVEYPYDATMFDQYWVPRESLLQEWVRKNIREVELPIPGTNKRVKCVVSVLQLGGGCGLYDPNINAQPAEARPPPEIPVKRNPLPPDETGSDGNPETGG